MIAQSFQCPSCAAPLIPRENAPVISCPHCYTSVIVPEELRQISDDAQWTTLLYETFTSNENNWRVGNETGDRLAVLNQSVADGRYRWEAQLTIPTTITTSWFMGHPVSDFHLTVNCKHIAGSRAGSSWGVVFRIQDNQNYYSFRITDSQFFSISVVEESAWLNLVEWTRTEAIKSKGVNQLEVVAHEAHFTFLINGQIVNELEDHRYSQGLVGLAIEAYNTGETTIFDFLDFTLRARRGVDTYKNPHPGTGSGTIILCPYCLSPVNEETVICPICAQDTTKDAKFELTLSQYDAEAKKACPYCGAEILNLAIICPACRQRQ